MHVTSSIDATVASAAETEHPHSLHSTDPDIAEAIFHEVDRQNSGLELIASENFVSTAILEAMGSALTNKYAEGYPGRRYCGGCEFVDVAESLAINRAKALFGADHANVQPHSGAQANMVAYFALLKPRDTVLGMDLAHGGHLTHGHPLNFSGQLYTIVPYGVRRDDERIDYEELERLARDHRPQLIMVGASAYPRVIDFARIAAVAAEVGAAMVADMAHIAGLVAADLHPSPVPHADIVTTTTHKTLRGPRGGLILCDDADLVKAIDRAVFPGLQGGPHNHTTAALAVALKEAATDEFKAYAHQIVANSRALAEALMERGFDLLGMVSILLLMVLAPPGDPGDDVLVQNLLDVDLNPIRAQFDHEKDRRLAFGHVVEPGVALGVIAMRQGRQPSGVIQQQFHSHQRIHALERLDDLVQLQTHGRFGLSAALISFDDRGTDRIAPLGP